ncbi:MAG: sigma-54 dependent transcriptional regulator [Bacteroidota bacterium]
MADILIIDDDRTVCKSLELLLRRYDHQVHSIHLPQDVETYLHQNRPDLIILDMNFTIDTSGRQGLRMLDKVLGIDRSLSVILITGWATLQLAVEGMKRGAKDFLAKPWDNKHLLNSVSTILTLTDQQSQKSSPASSDHRMIGESKAWSRVVEMIHRVAGTDASILITGESGTGKEMVAEAIHAGSKRWDQPFVKVNLGGISTSLFESEMFGHVRGAFTDASNDREGRFTKADGGTIFLDEIGDLALESQVKLLRVLQEKSYEVLGSSNTVKTDVRVVCATHRALQEFVAEGRFREDLYYRINLITITLPSLAERKEDIPLLVRHFVNQVGTSYELEPPMVTDEAMDWLQRQTYPGNIRQLRNIVERTTLLSVDKREIDIRDFQYNMVTAPKPGSSVSLPEIGQITLEELERRMIEKALRFHNHSVSKTARSLGLTRSSLYRRMDKHRLN